MLTKEDYKKIEEYLLRNSIKDSDFPEIKNVDGEEYITVHKKGANYKVSVRNTQRVGKETLEGGEIFNSYEEPDRNQALGLYSHSEGVGNISRNEGEHSEGKFNKSNSDTISSIGIGTDSNNRKNAVEVNLNGDIFIDRIGEYNISENKVSLQEVIYNILERLEEIENEKPLLLE